jgi:dihydrofolate synthase/folylpolyglutamate synthase
VTPLEFLFSLERLGMKFGLENMRTICAALDHPERSFQSVIVAGTNGKGSVTAMLSAALHAAGIRSARYTSPHLERIEERFVVGERDVDTNDLEVAAGIVQHIVQDLVERGSLETLPTFFECATAIAFELFRRNSVELAIIEVGLGGRLDATNVISPMAAAITSIDFDHQALLGNTFQSIAREKAGVIKPGIPVVIGPLTREADQVVDAVCRERGAHLIRSRERVQIHEGPRSTIDIATTENRLADVKLVLRGRHQHDNAAVAMCVMEELRRLGVKLDDRGMRAGFEQAQWPGRLEAAQWHGAELLLDAAHNAAGTRALADYLHDVGWTNVTLLIGVMHDKDVTAMLEPLAPLCASIVCTTPPTPRAMAAVDLAARAAEHRAAPADIRAIPDPAAALESACQPGARVIACGSIFLIGPLRGILR